jgi:predicted O-methyltransferase YrrM
MSSEKSEQSEHYEYKFTRDWFSLNVPNWEIWLAKFKGKPNLKYLEIGSYQGRSVTWLMDNIFTDESCTATCLDTFEGSDEHTDFEKENIKELFIHNTKKFRERLDVCIGKSQDLLRNGTFLNETYDVIYIDADHHAKSCLSDCILSIPLLKVGGNLILDDYSWIAAPYERAIDFPRIACDIIRMLWHDELKVIGQTNQLVFEKVKSS